MSEENINNIIGYFHHYPDLSPEQLAGHILESGYPMKDLKEALHRMGISPIVIPGYKEPEPSASNPILSKTSVLIICIIILLAFIGGAGWFISHQKPQKTQFPGHPQQALISDATPSAAVQMSPTHSAEVIPTLSHNQTGTSSVDNPIMIFRSMFIRDDYKVSVHTSDVSPAFENKPATTSEDSFVVYSKHGALVRMEGTASTTIYKDSAMYTLSVPDKTYTVINNINTQQAEPLSFIPNIIVLKAEDDKVGWKKKSDTEWTGIWKVNPNNADAYTTITLTQDPKTLFITKISALSNITKSTQTITITFEKAAAIDSFAQIPSGFTKKN